MFSKKLLLLFLSVVFVFCSLSSCGGGEKYTAQQLSDILLEKGFSSEEMSSVSKTETDNWFNFSSESIEESFLFSGTNEQSCLLLAVMRLKEVSDKEEIINGIGNYTKNLASSFRVLNSESAKIQTRLLYSYEDILILVISDNYSPCEDFLKEIGASPVS